MSSRDVNQARVASARMQAPTPTVTRDARVPVIQPEHWLTRIREACPGLKVEGAFVVPSWFCQQRSWFREPYGSDSPTYNYPLPLRIHGPLNQRALELSLREILRRHGVLRSVFRIIDGELVQIVVAAEPLPLPLVDLSTMASSGKETLARELLLEESHKPFDLAKETLLRVSLLRLADDDHILQFTTHHLVYDDWSSGILIRELSACYRGFVKGTPRPLAELAFHYGDFARWQQQRLQGKELLSRLSFWKERLAHSNDFHHLTTDHPRPSRRNCRGAREVAAFSEDLLTSLTMLSQQNRVSLFMTLVAGFQCLLHRYSGHDDIGLASCGANRPLSEVEGLIGRFGNVFILRTALSGNPTFAELLARVRESSLTTYPHQDIPFGRLVEELAPAADSSRNPLFQVMFILQNAPKENWQLPGLSVDWFRLDAGTAKYDLCVWLKTQPAFEVVLEYRTDLFAANTIKRMLAAYQEILREMAGDVQKRIDDISLARLSAPGQTQPPCASRKEIVSPSDDVEVRLVEIWEAAFGKRPVGINQNFFELGGDSLLATRLFARIEKAFKAKIPLGTLFKAQTIAELAGLLRVPGASAGQSSLVAVQPRGSRPPLFCVHDHTGEMIYCRGLSQHLGFDQPLYGLQAQGLIGKAAHRTVEEMAAHYTGEIQAVQSTGPYFLIGYCFGGMVVFEMARMLRLQGHEVAMAAMFNAPSPGSLNGWPFKQFSYLKTKITIELKKLRALQKRERMAFFANKTRGFARLANGSLKTGICRIVSGPSKQGAPNWADRVLGVTDLNIEAAKAYNPRRCPVGITLFLTEEASSLYAVDPATGWSGLAEGGVDMYGIPGDNTSMFGPKFVGRVVETLQPALRKAQSL
jgi:thioesterase domain-containing protein/acyl carrier protein